MRSVCFWRHISAAGVTPTCPSVRRPICLMHCTTRLMRWFEENRLMWSGQLRDWGRWIACLRPISNEGLPKRRAEMTDCSSKSNLLRGLMQGAGLHMIAARVLLLSLTALLSGCLWETIDTSYATHHEAVAAGQVEKGWIPRWVPTAAKDIREVHNLDTSASALSFWLPPGSVLQAPDGCEPISYRRTVGVSFERSWWPSADALGENYTFSNCRPGATEYEFIGRSVDGQHVIHWRTYAR
jgi:hypothetical protein